MQPREITFVLWGHCQHLLDDPRKCRSRTSNIMAAIVHVYFFVFKTDKVQSLINRVSVQTILSLTFPFWDLC